MCVSGPTDEVFLEALHTLMPSSSSETKPGVKKLLGMLRERHPDWDIDSRRVRESMQKLAPTRHCANCASDRAAFFCTGCDADSRPYVPSSVESNVRRWRVRSNVPQVLLFARMPGVSLAVPQKGLSERPPTIDNFSKRYDCPAKHGHSIEEHSFDEWQCVS